MPRSSDYRDSQRFHSRHGRTRTIDFAALRGIYYATRDLERNNRSDTK